MAKSDNATERIHQMSLAELLKESKRLREQSKELESKSIALARRVDELNRRNAARTARKS